MNNPKNIQAIEEWVKVHRPDLVNYLPLLAKNDTILLVLTVGFESGRQFQHDNPDIPLNQPHFYL